MSPKGSTKRGREIRDWILHQVMFYPRRIVAEAVSHFGISRQAVSLHIGRLCKEGKLQKTGKKTRKHYFLSTRKEWTTAFSIKGATEGSTWSKWASPCMQELVDPPLPRNVYDICYHGFTEMLNNAIDHSEGKTATVRITATAATVQISIEDDGVGIFHKITREMGLPDEREAIIELSKGKLTTDADHHSGEGIFFTSRMFDSFTIESGGLFFDHTPQDDWLTEMDASSGADMAQAGTIVTMTIFRDSGRSSEEVFDEYASEDNDYAFTRTHVPLSLAQYGTDLLVSRSQAKRVLARFDRFEEVILDFKNVPRIGQAFADEIFRVHKIANPAAKVVVVNANAKVKRMICRAEAALREHVDRTYKA